MEPQRSLRARPLQGKFIISLNNISRTWNTFIFLKSTSIPKPNGSNFRCSGALSPSGDNRDERLIFHQWHFCMNTCTRVYIHTHTHMVQSPAWPNSLEILASMKAGVGGSRQQPGERWEPSTPLHSRRPRSQAKYTGHSALPPDCDRQTRKASDLKGQSQKASILDGVW